MYDQYGEEGLKGNVPPPGSGGFPGGFPGGSDGGSGYTSFRFNTRSPDDIFSEFFGFSSPFGMGDMGGSRGGVGGSSAFGRGGFEDIFSQFNRGAGGVGEASSMPSMPRKAPPIERTLQCSLEDLYKGTTKKMKVSKDTPDYSG